MKPSPESRPDPSEGAPQHKRRCQCSGSCVPAFDPVDRRTFLGRTAAGAAGLLAAPAWLRAPLSAAELEAWTQTLTAPASGAVYRSAVHTDARMHLGGIGTGNLEIGSDGQFTMWQLFNTLRDGIVPFHFAVRVGDVARLLQTAGGPAAPRVPRVEMTVEYPVARLRYIEPGLPVELELEVFSPFAPLDTALSSVPVAALIFRITNRSAQPQTVSIASFLQNPVGYDAIDPIDGDRHPNFGGNINEPCAEGAAKGLFFRAQPGEAATLDRPIRLCVSSNLATLNNPPPDRPDNLRVEPLEGLAKGAASDAPESRVVWIEEPATDFAAAQLRAARDAVEEGATLVLAGATLPLVAQYATATGGQPLSPTSGRPDILFDDFEHGYDQWTLSGTAFGTKPAGGTLPDQQRVSGFSGRGLVNTYLGGDGTRGKATSRAFTIERRFIRFAIGGGSHADTQLRLVIGGQIVRRASGKDNERLEPISWDVSEHAGKSAQLEIVDEATGGWGHVNVDQIEFSDHPANRATLALLEDLLPIRCTAVRAAADRAPGDPNTLAFAGVTLREGAQSQATAGGLNLYVRPLGKGRVVLASGPVLRPNTAGTVSARQGAYATLCELAGARYKPLRGQSIQAPGFGSMALAALEGEVTTASAIGDWADAWNTFVKDGRWPSDTHAAPSGPTPAGRTTTGAVATSVTVAPNARLDVPFLLAWHYPNKYNAHGVWMGCHYATRWPDARAVLKEASASLAAWRAQTDLFRRTLYESTLPAWLLDCLTANAAIIRHIGVVFRIANGDIYGWEGSNGCCQPTCTHVWGYEQTLARLFPDLEREMRRIDFKHQQRKDGGVNNRTDVPSPPRPTGEQPFADGHASCILKAYREALNTPDGSFFQDYWPHIRRAVDYLIERDAKSHGGAAAGYLEDDQWNTYDEALHGVTTFISGYYLAALRAGEEWARRVGDTASADRFHALFEQGQARLIELCWDGEYFRQHLPGYEQMPGEVGPGCMSDQLIGQWWAHQLGLGYLFPRDKVVSALKAVFKHNWKPDLTGWKHAPRAFAGDNDKGLIICTWPKGGRPGHVMLYSDEVWTGIEYQVAAHMIYEGLLTEGLAIVKGARERYDGVPRRPIARNPWNEIECGGHYARAMSSWSLLLALSGWTYDGPARALRLEPRYRPEHIQCLFAGPEGWGRFAQTIQAGRQRDELNVRWGRLAVKQIDVALRPGPAPAAVTVRVGGRDVACQFAAGGGQAQLRFGQDIVLEAGQSLVVEFA